MTHHDAERSARYLTFRSEGRLYAVIADKVSEVVRMSPLARVPQAPKSLLGLANLRGMVVPVAGVRSLLGRIEIAVSDRSRLVVLGGATPVALAVDEVASLETVDARSVKSAEADMSAEADERLDGIFQTTAGVTKILDIDALLTRAFPRTVARRATGAASRAAVAAPASHAAGRRLVTFLVAGQEYALSLDAVREIVLAPDDLTQVPGSDEAVRGVISYRDGLLPLLSLRVLLGVGAEVAGNARTVIVTAVSGVIVGLVADSARDILTVDPQRVEPAPKVLSARAGGEARIQEIYRAGERRLISILVTEALFREDVMQKLSQATAGAAAIGQAVTDTQTVELRFLVFRLDGNEFALPIDAVDEVARVPDQITKLPKTPKFLEGVVNLRGAVLPVIDQRRRFDMAPSGGGASRRLVVVTSGDHRAGLIVDGVTEVLRCSAEAIQPAPDLTGDALSLVGSVINLGAAGRMVLLLDPAELLSRAERGLLDSFNRTATARDGRPAAQ
jgi:purine-binding chemotaxis protein CheW